MPRYIDADAAVERINNAKTCLPPEAFKPGVASAFKTAVSIINTTPAADVAPVRHAVRQPLSSPEAPTSLFEDFCPRCHAYLFRSDSYCPTCGAKMDGKGED